MQDRVLVISSVSIWVYPVWVLIALLLCNVGVSVAQPAGSESFDFTIQKRSIVGDVKTIRVTQGSQVVVRWNSDEATVLHVHGYDLKIEVKPGAVAEMRFEAHATGRYPVTSHGFGEKSGGHGHHGTLLYIEIYPN